MSWSQSCKTKQEANQTAKEFRSCLINPRNKVKVYQVTYKPLFENNAVKEWIVEVV